MRIKRIRQVLAVVVLATAITTPFAAMTAGTAHADTTNDIKIGNRSQFVQQGTSGGAVARPQTVAFKPGGYVISH